MKFTVVWKPSAERNLAELWAAASDRTAVTVAADRMESLVGVDPFDVGESRTDLNSRIAIEGPLGFAYRIHEQDRIVEVLRVWLA